MWALVNYILGAVILDVVISFILATIITTVHMAILDERGVSRMTDEYIRKADAAGVIEKEMKNYVSDIWYKSATHSALNDVNENIKSLEPADVVQVCRCKDCKHFYFADNRIPQEQRYVCEIGGEIWKPDSFCSYGERKE